LDRRDRYRCWEKNQNGPRWRLQVLAQKVEKSCDQDGGKGIDQQREAE
jgi:hypothetical protein